MFRDHYVCSHGKGALITVKIALYKMLKMICYNKRQGAYNGYTFDNGDGGTRLYVNLGKINNKLYKIN